VAASDFKSFDARDFEFRNSKGKVKAAPVLPKGIRIADTHCHLNTLDSPELAIARAAHRGFGFLCCLVDPADDSPDLAGCPDARASLELSGAWLAVARDILASWGEEGTPLPELVFAVGVHPHNARNYKKYRAELLELLEDPQVTCLGEIGLDYHYDLSPRKDQREVFAAQLELAQELGLPVSLHLREAHDEALEILRSVGVPDAGCIVHCFNLDAQVLQPFLDLGCYIAFGGPLTFRKAFYTRDACLHVPIDRLLTETDAPYMAPEPLRGTVCMPDMTVYTLRMLLDCFGFAGDERALEVLMPRPVDIENGAEKPDLAALDFPALRKGLNEAQFCRQVYANATRLLGGKPATRGGSHAS
jgi:TatD DNase family protein